jgi:drug/metabolite transporter (DMT)-like permease
MFIKVAVEDLEPAAMMALRLLVAAAILVPVLVWRIGLVQAVAQLGAARWDSLFLGVVNSALPFTLIAWGEQHIDSGVAAIANATVPIFNVLLTLRLVPSERVTGGRAAGVLVGLAGVVVLAGLDPSGGWWAVAGTLAVVVASLAYAIGGIYGQKRVARTAAPVLATGSTLAGGLVLLPLALLQRPDAAPDVEALGSVLALAVLGTAIAQLVLFRMLHLHGAARVSLVTYLLPPAALFYGALLLGEPVTGQMVAGLGLILTGVALGSGAMRLPRRPAVSPAP